MDYNLDYFGSGPDDWDANQKKVKDNVNNPSHYTQGKVECIDAIESATVNKIGLDAVCTANIIKYIWRCENKNGLEDLKKAQWYLDKLITHNEQKRNRASI